MTCSEGVERSQKYRKPGGVYWPHGTEFVTFSAGVAQYPQDGVDLQALYRAANQAKAGGITPYKGSGSRERLIGE